MEETKVVICPYCGSEAECLTSEEFYGTNYNDTYVYSCKPCDARVGTHPSTKNPLGTMANKELRSLRNKAHAFFDPLWKSRRMSRKQAYLWLQENMGLDRKTGHIAKFDEDQCRRLISLLSK